MDEPFERLELALKRLAGCNRRAVTAQAFEDSNRAYREATKLEQVGACACVNDRIAPTYF
jgi:hypothetical protein